ncbi:MAG: GldG family protein [Deltaproteobacteria bacterium]|nr:GldG family protein [Deltaproteobacteria bacterium]
MAMKLEQTRRLKYGTNALLFTGAVVAIVAVLYGIIDRRHIRWDFTAHKELSLSDQTKQVLSRLNQKVEIIAFFRRGEGFDDVFIKRKVNDVLKEYSYLSPNIHFEMVDPDLEVQKALAENLTTDGTIIVRSGTQRKDIYKSQLFGYDRSSEEALPEFTGESLFTNAILTVTEGSKKVVYFLTGHGERNLEETGPNGYAQIKGYLEKENNEVKMLNLLTGSPLPEDLSVLVIASPSMPLTENEEELLIGALKKVGRTASILILTDPLLPNPCPRIFNFLGVTAQNDLVIDPKKHFLLGPHYPAPLLSDHEVTASLKNKGMSPIFYLAKSLVKGKPTVDTFKTEDLLTTSAEAWGEINISEKVSPKFEKGKDFAGPLTLAIAVGGDAPHAIVVGDSDFVANGLIQIPGNMDLFLNMVSWLSGTRDSLAIRPTKPELRTISLTEGKARFIFYFTQFGYPALFLIAAGIVWWRRRGM